MDPLDLDGPVIGKRPGVTPVERERRPPGALWGGAIMAASGSLAGVAAVAGAEDGSVAVVVGAIGGGPTGLALSSGFSPGKTQTLRSLS